MLLATALALLITGCAQQTFTVQKQTGSSSTTKEHHHFHVSWNWAEEKTVDAAKICMAEMLLKQKPSKHLAMDCSVLLLFRHLYSAGSACIAHTQV